ncbi:MAG: lipopolysaccharide heptosyltransferase II [Gammaproteobacteria bacterium]
MAKPVSQILMVAPAWVGDFVMAQSLFRVLKAANPDVQIDIIAPKHSGPLAERMPEIRNFIELPLGHGQLELKTRYAIGKKLRDTHYDQAIVLPNSFKSALIPWFAKIPKRTGWMGECRVGLLNDVRRLDPKEYPLMVERFVALAYDKKNIPSKLDCPRPRLVVKPDSLSATFASLGMEAPTRPVWALCPGAEYGPAKRWPAEYYGELARRLIADGADVWLFGSPKEAFLGDTIQAHCEGRAFNVIGRTQLAQAIDLMSCVTGVITNDSGLMHVAAALDKPMIALYGSSSQSFTPPLSDKVRVLNLQLSCSPCFERVCPLQHFKCMNDMLPEYVYSHVQTLRRDYL